MVHARTLREGPDERVLGRVHRQPLLVALGAADIVDGRDVARTTASDSWASDSLNRLPARNAFHARRARSVLGATEP